VKRFFLRLFEQLLARMVVFPPVREPGQQVVPVLLEAPFPVRHDTPPDSSRVLRPEHAMVQNNNIVCRFKLLHICGAKRALLW
jgi:hypothetical protein